MLFTNGRFFADSVLSKSKLHGCTFGVRLNHSGDQMDGEASFLQEDEQSVGNVRFFRMLRNEIRPGRLKKETRLRQYMCRGNPEKIAHLLLAYAMIALKNTSLLVLN